MSWKVDRYGVPFKKEKRRPRLTAKDWLAIRDALNFVLAGDWDASSHGVTREEMERTLDKTNER